MHNGIPEGEEREKRTEEIFKTVMTESFYKLMSDTKPHIHKAQRTPSRINAPKTIPRHIIFKLQKIKDKEKILQETKEEKPPYLYRSKNKSYMTFPEKPCKQESRVIYL